MCVCCVCVTLFQVDPRRCQLQLLMQRILSFFFFFFPFFSKEEDNTLPPNEAGGVKEVGGGGGGGGPGGLPSLLLLGNFGFCFKAYMSLSYLHAPISAKKEGG